MLTIFAIPKPFRGHNNVIQVNAIRSWLCLRPQCEIILFGKDEGTAEVASQNGLRHVPDVECNEYGTPLVSSLFGAAQRLASYNTLCYVNADIILTGDFLPAISQVSKPSFLLVGRRWDIELKEPLDFENPDWERQVRALVAEKGKSHPVTGIDYFVFSRGLYSDIPPLAIGRGGWDNWLIYRARASKAPVIDATAVIMAIHQDHDYSHHPGGAQGVWKGPEIKRNTELMGGVDHAFTLDYATHLLTAHGLKSALKPRHLYFRLRAVPILHPRLGFLLAPLKVLHKLGSIFRKILQHSTL